jgi:ABC-type multidrug transport system ATPase subunit
MWRLLRIVAGRQQHAVVLTTHNMLECEAVCSRIGIMKMGELVCMGNSQHLRSAYGTGFLLEVTLIDSSFLAEAKNFISSAFLNAVVVDEHVNTINYEFPVTSISKLSTAFRIMEDNKARLHIADYSLSQSTLEQVMSHVLK